MSENEIEQLLRSAPRPAPPAHLRARLIARIPRAHRASGRISSSASQTFWRRWWPALAPAAVSAACAVVMTWQQFEMRDLRQTLASTTIARINSADTGPAPQAAPPSPAPQPAALNSDAELTRLRDTASQLRSEVARLENLKSENAALRGQIGALPGDLSPAERAAMNDAMNDARNRAETIVCINNLKQIGLAVRVWSLDNADKYPTGLQAVSNELHLPKILVCPADTNRAAATDWASYTSANCSYEYLAPEGSDVDGMRILTRCPIHGNIGLCDGAVMNGIAKNHPEQIVQREGKLYFVPNQSAPVDTERGVRVTK